MMEHERSVPRKLRRRENEEAARGTILRILETGQEEETSRDGNR